MGRSIVTTGTTVINSTSGEMSIKDITVTAAAAGVTVSIQHGSTPVEQEKLACPANDTRNMSYSQAEHGWFGLRLVGPVQVVVTGAGAFVRLDW